MNDTLQSNIDDFLDDWSASQEVRDMANEEFRFYAVPGGHWEDWYEDDYADRAKLEIDHTSDYVDRTFSQWTQNRQAVNFQSTGAEGSDDLADIMDGLLRRDMRDNGGQTSLDTAVKESMCPGFGAVVLNQEHEDEGDPENEAKNVVITEHPNAYSTVFFDFGSRRPDKLDARHCTILTPYSVKEFDRRWPDANPHSLMVGDRSSFNWSTSELVYVATRYEVEEERTVLQVWSHPDSGEVTKLTKEEAEDNADELEMAGFRYLRSRTIKKKRAYKTLFTGSDILEPKKRIAGEYIPVIPFFGNRFHVDGMEYFYGIVRKRMDAQRILNMTYSLAAEGAANSSESKMIFAPEQVENPQIAATWSSNDGAYKLLEPLRDSAGNPLGAGALGQTPGTQISSSLANLIDMSRESVMRGTGGAPQDVIDPDASGKAINAVIKRIDLNVSFIFDNINKGLKHLGTVWESIAKEIYSDSVNRDISIITERGDSKRVVLNQRQGLGGKVTQVNDISKGRFKVIVDTSTDYQTAKEESFEALKDILGQMNPQSAMREVIALELVLLKEGKGLEGIQEWIRNQHIVQGYKKPESEEEMAMLQQHQQNAQNQPEDPNAEYLRAEAEKAKTAANLNMAKIADTGASAVKKAAEAEETKVDVALKKQQLLQPQHIQQ